MQASRTGLLVQQSVRLVLWKQAFGGDSSASRLKARTTCVWAGDLALSLWCLSEYQPMNPTFERALWASTPALRYLAPLDAILAPALALYWIRTLPASGGLVGAVLGVFCLWIGAKRAYRALRIRGLPLDDASPAEARHRDLGRDGDGQARLVHPRVVMHEGMRHQAQKRKSGEQDRLRRLVCVTRSAR